VEQVVSAELRIIPAKRTVGDKASASIADGEYAVDRRRARLAGRAVPVIQQLPIHPGALENTDLAVFGIHKDQIIRTAGIIFRDLTEINLVSCSLVAGHDLMEEAPGYDKWRLEQDKLRRIPKTIEMDPLAQDNNDGFLVVQAAEHEVRYAFCKDASAIEPVSAAEYLKGYRDDLDRWEPQDRATVEAMVEDLDGYELLSKEDIEQIFQKHYDKKLNIEGYQEPERQPHRHEPLREVMGEAKDRAQTKQQPSKGKAHAPKRHDPER